MSEIQFMTNTSYGNSTNGPAPSIHESCNAETYEEALKGPGGGRVNYAAINFEQQARGLEFW